MAEHYVSPSALGDFRKCRRCFWLDRNQKIKRPRGAFPTLPGGIDRVMKAYFDEHRAKGTLPPEIADAMPGDGEGTTLYSDTVHLTAMRNARKPVLQMIIGNVKLVGGIDDLLVGPGGGVSPFDVKTKGSLIKPDADPFEWYRMQLNDYGLLLQAGGFALTGQGYLGYWSPVQVMAKPADLKAMPTSTWMAFQCQVFEMDLDLEAARAEVMDAGTCLDGELPEADPGCETCAFVAEAATAVAA